MTRTQIPIGNSVQAEAEAAKAIKAEMEEDRKVKRKK
jgi:hypothetical protein